MTLLREGGGPRGLWGISGPLVQDAFLTLVPFTTHLADPLRTATVIVSLTP